jgi:hypothetical protein
MIFARQRVVPEWTDAFYKRFPYLFADVLTGTESGAESVSPLTDWGVECGIGWYKLVERLCVDLEAMIVALPKNERVTYRASQVKQKFGTLRFYMEKETETMTKRIGAAENESMNVCELCGRPDHEDRPCPTKR